MSQARKTALVLAGSVVVVAVFVLGSRKISERQHTFDEINALRERLYEARTTAQSCQRTLAARERAFRRLDATVDSLRGEVDAFEALDERGVPEHQYEEYLETFDRYNDSVGAWENRADELRAKEDECRVAVEAHNALRDSLEERLELEGIGGS